MAEKEVPKPAQQNFSMAASTQGDLDEGLQYKEKTTFGDPVPENATFASSSTDSDEEGQAFSKNPFLDPDVAAHWSAVYENSRYECRHEFDPSYTWTDQEEKKIVRRLDWHVCLWACIMFFGLQVDRGNLVQAVSDNLLTDLHLNTNGKTLHSCDYAFPAHQRLDFDQITISETLYSCSRFS